MRADFYARVAVYTQLADCMSENQVTVTLMNNHERTEAIELPARKVGLRRAAKGQGEKSFWISYTSAADSFPFDTNGAVKPRFHFSYFPDGQARQTTRVAVA